MVCVSGNDANHGGLMGKDSSVGFADASFNFVRGCVEVSAGCDNCSARTTAAKAPDVLGAWGPAGTGTRIVTGESDWNAPLKWNERARSNGVPMRVLAMSLGDAFEPWDGPVLDSKGQQVFVTRAGAWRTKQGSGPPDAGSWDPLTKDHAIERWLGLVDRTPNLQWLVLTKYPEYIVPTLARVGRLGFNDDSMRGSVVAQRWLQGVFPKNVWLGVSAENQAKMSERVFYLRQVEARVRFLVLQPLLAPVKVGHWFDRARFESDSFNWLVIGGEHGEGARKFDTAWAEDLVAEAKVFGLPVWVQGVGSNPMTPANGTSVVRLALSDDRGEVPADWPEALRVRELPELEGY